MIRMFNPIALLAVLSAGPAIAAEQAQLSVGRYSMSTLSDGNIVVLDTITGCLDLVRFFDTRTVVEPVTGYPDEDPFETAFGRPVQRGSAGDVRNPAHRSTVDTHSCPKAYRAERGTAK